MFVKYFLIIFSLIIYSSCSKEVNKKNLNLTPTPTSNNPSVSIPNAGSYLSLDFANHATVQEEDDLLTLITIRNSGYVDVPKYVSNLTYVGAPSHPNLTLHLNYTVVCVYQWYIDRYRAQPSCLSNIQLLPNDVLYMSNIPRSQIVSLDMLVK